MATTYPDATTTGVPSDVTLKQSGSLVITTPGAVIEGLDIRGSVVIDAPNVTLKNCKISDGGYDVVLIKPGVTGAVVQNCDIDNQGSGGQGLAGQGTFVSNNIHGAADGIDVRGDNTVIRDNFIHDMQGTSDSHFDGIQADGGFENLTISHNTVINEHGQTSAVMLDNYWGPIDNVKIDDNLLVGGGYTVYLNEVADGQVGGGPVTNVSFTNNHIVPGAYGDMDLRTELGHDPVISGNASDGDAMLASLQMDGQPSSSADAGTGVSDPSPSQDSGTDSHGSGPVASGDQGSTSDDSSADAGSSSDAGTGVSDPSPSQGSGTDSHDSGPVASGDQGSASSGSDGASADPGSTSNDSSANAGTSPTDQSTSTSGSGSHDGHHHGRWHRSSDSASADSDSTDWSGNGSHSHQDHKGNHHWRSGKDGSGADTKSTTSNFKADDESSHSTSKHSDSSQDKSGSEHTNAPAGELNAGQKHAGTSHKAGDGSHGLGHDSFVFGSHFHDMAEKLQQRASHHDFDQFSKNTYDHLADVLNHASKAGHDGIHAGASGDTLTFKDAKASNHHHNDFHFS